MDSVEDNLQKQVPDIAKNILTLRYDNQIKSSLDELTWNDFTPKTNDIPIEIIEQKIEEYLKNKINDSISSISISLSGGVDSTLVLGFIRKVFPNIKINAISVKFSDSIDESKNAKKIADFFDAEHHIVEVDNYLEILPNAIGITKMPFWDNHWLFVAQNAKKFSNFLASGDGGDEVFGGYSFRYEKFLSLIDSSSTPRQKAESYLNCHERDWVVDQVDVFNNKLNFSWSEIMNSLIPFFENNLDPLDQVFLADFNGKLRYNFSFVNQSINSHYNLETVSPLLSHDLISLLSHCKPEHKYDKVNNLGKLHLRKILDKMNISNLVMHEKLGFSVNTKSLWKNFGKKIFNYYFEDSRLINNEIISKDWILKYSNQEEPEIRNINKLLGILALEIWYRIFISKEMKTDIKLSI